MPLCRCPAFLRPEQLAAHFLDDPFDKKASTGGFELMGLMPARASRSRPLASSLRSCSSAPLRGFSL
jgi:hypothetical protein